MHENIIDALRRGAADEALTAAREAVAAQPQDPMAQRLLAAALRLAGDREGAVEAIDRAVALAPDDASIQLERAGLLLQERKLDEAEAALARSVGLDPNQFPAYIVQAQLALARGEIGEAERLARTAARIAPEHPQLAAVEGSIALRRGDADRALAILSTAAKRWPWEGTLRHSLGFAYWAKGHLAFAEEAFRALREAKPDSMSLRFLLADLMRQQGRPGDALAELEPLMRDPSATPAMRRMVGELELAAGRNDAAKLHLRESLLEHPGERRTLLALIEAWRRLGDSDEARGTLDQLLEVHPGNVDLWRARLMFEEYASEGAVAVVDRWLAATPDAVPALEARATLHDAAGEGKEAEAVARRITELQPGHAAAEMRIVRGLLSRDPEAGIEHIERLLSAADNEQASRQLRQALGRALDIAGQPAAAAATWAELHVELAPRRLPLPEPAPAPAEWPRPGELSEPAPAVILLWGTPGSMVERLAATLQGNGLPLRADRLGEDPPDDLFQRFSTIRQLASGEADPHGLIEEWRAALPARGISDGQIHDLLLWWDNAALIALRPHLPNAQLVFALRDPRDMLLDWLAFGAQAPFALETPLVGARWMADVLGQIADIHEQDLFPHQLVKMDAVLDDPEGIAAALAPILSSGLRPLPAERLGGERLPPGHWRRFHEPLGEAFALLEPVARRLGYEAD